MEFFVYSHFIFNNLMFDESGRFSWLKFSFTVRLFFSNLEQTAEKLSSPRIVTNLFCICVTKIAQKPAF